ncbi:MAG: hypothetical protein KJ818_06300, partial [Candidatus Omnitrophica bacterium]|nr:hypothetical protein [Candidatus Omnitrophota bacterium]
MKKVMTGFFIFMISLCLFVAKLDADTILPFSITEIQPQITMDLRDASLKDVLKILSIQAGMNFVAADTVQDRRLTVYLDKVTLKSAMDKLFSANSLTYDYDKEANIFIVKDWGRLGVETVTRVFHLKYASVSTSQMRSEKTTAGISSSSDSSSTTSSSSSSSTTSGDIGSGTITDVIKGIVSKDGSVVEDCRTNSLIISDIPSRMPIIAKTIEELDLPTPQVVLEVEMLDVSKNIIDTIGFKFGQTPFTAVVTGATAPLGFPFGSWMSTFANEANRGSIAINSGTNTYQVQLDWLRKN